MFAVHYSFHSISQTGFSFSNITDEMTKCVILQVKGNFTKVYPRIVSSLNTLRYQSPTHGGSFEGDQLTSKREPPPQVAEHGGSITFSRHTVVEP
jgi:hypothetical protein